MIFLQEARGGGGCHHGDQAPPSGADGGGGTGGRGIFLVLVVARGRLGCPLGRRGLLAGGRRRGRRGLGAEEVHGQQHLVDGVDGERPGGAQRGADGGVDDPRGDVDGAVAGGGDVDGAGPVGAGGLGADGVAGGLEGLHGVEGGDDVGLHQRHLVLLRERVEGARLEAVEGVVGGGEHREARVGVVGLRVQLRVLLRRRHQPDELGVLPVLLQHRRHVRRRGRLGRRPRRRRVRRLGRLGRRGRRLLAQRRRHRRQQHRQQDEGSPGRRHCWRSGARSRRWLAVWLG
uniref:Uncharacterized protein n=1 Tax=Triticum urartu TaxID=4572 RepID=A0A8R7K4F4_TRIUA